MDLSFGVAGPGRVGMSLAKAFAAAGLSCAGVYGGVHAKARAAELGVRHFNEPLGLVAAADVIFISVPDRFINEAAESMAKAAAQAGLDVCGKYFYHVSGSAGLDELAPLKALGAETGSLHPLQSFAAPVKALRELAWRWTAAQRRRSLVLSWHIFQGQLPLKCRRRSGRCITLRRAFAVILR